MTHEPPALSVCVLAYRSADTIESFVRALATATAAVEPDYELVLVGNYLEGSDDRTPEVVRTLAAADPRIRAVAKAKRGMMGWDMRSGLAACRGRVLGVIDGDGQMPPEDVARVYRLLVDRDLDLAKTYRVRRDDGPLRRALSSAYNTLFRVFFPGTGLRDANSKPKLFTRAAYERLDLRSDGWFIDAEIMIQARRLGLRTGEVPTEFHCLDDRPSFVRPAAILEFAWNLAAARLRELVRSR